MAQIIVASDGTAERCRREEMMRPAGEQVNLPIYSSSAAGSANSSSSSSSSENVHSSVSHVSEVDTRGFRTHHYNAEVTADMKQHSKGPPCFRCGDTSHGWRNCDVASGDESVKQRADQFSRVKKASDKRESVKREGKNKKRYKTNVISGDTPVYNLMSLIDHSKLSKVSAPVSNYILVDSGSHRLAV